MNLKKYLASFEGMKQENRLGRITVLVLAGVVAVQTMFVLNRPTVVTIQPWTLTRDAQLTESSASESYIEAWGLALALLVGNVTPESADFVAKRLRPLLDPRIYHEAIDAVYANAKELKDDRVSMRFEPRLVKFERSTGKVYITGTSYVRQGTSLAAEQSSERTYEFVIRISNYAPLVSFIDTYAGTPRTKEVLEYEERLAKDKRDREHKQLLQERLSRQSDAKLFDEAVQSKTEIE